ncbi:retrovirus-related Pol polyprotein from transposon 17.6 [Trichonephila clavipes]|nr:retrovirus-related Pol polyprotein from transposon 17.6 [Trichonephila clavipes]
MLQEGTIHPIQSPYASPVVLTHKNNGLPRDSPEAYRFAIDYRKLNAITKYPRYPLPVIDDLITNIPHTGVMSTLDLKTGYFQLAISPKDIEKTAFITRNGTFAFLRMPFGLSGAAPNFQKAIDIILKPVIGRFVSVYMDDVIITSPSFNEHLDHLNQVFTLLRDAGLTLNKDKCHFARDKLKYLGLVISKEGIETDHSKVKAITEMKPPKNSKKVSKFLGMAGWYKKFIPQYADICEPLYRLKKKGAKFNWSTEAQDSFDKIKRALTEAPVLQLPNFAEQFNLFTDASGVGIGAVLNQNHRPIAFASRTLNKAERNYNVTERECLAVIWALNKFKTYFGSLPVKALKLSEFNIEWEYRPGVQNVVSDVLSRHPVGNLDGSQISCAALRALALNSREQLIREQREDPELGHIYRYLENPDDDLRGSSRSQQGKFRGSRKTSSEQNNGHKSSKGNAGWEDPRLKRKVELNGSGDRKNVKRSKICRKRSLQGSEHRNQKRPTPEPKQGIQRAIPSSVSSRNYKYRRPNNPSQGSQSIAGPSHQQESRQDKSPTVASRHKGSGRYNKARETKTTKNGTKRAAERRTVWSKQTTAVRPCPFYLRSRVRQPEGFPEERRNGGIASIPQNNIRRRSLSVEALDGDPVDRSG